MSERTEQLRRDVAAECQKWAYPNHLPGNAAIRIAEPIIEELERELAEQKANYEHACQTIAQMHAAAVGEVRGPSRGVVEDVADMIAARDKRIAELEATRTRLENGNMAMAAELATLKAERASKPDQETRLYELLGNATGMDLWSVRLFGDRSGRIIRSENRTICEIPRGGGLSGAIAALEKLVAPTSKPTPEEVIVSARAAIGFARTMDPGWEKIDAAVRLADSLLNEKRKLETFEHCEALNVYPGAAKEGRSVATIVEQEPEWPKWFEWCGPSYVGEWNQWVRFDTDRSCRCYDQNKRQRHASFFGSLAATQQDKLWRRIPEPEWANGEKVEAAK